MGGQVAGGRVVVDEGGGQPQAGGGGQGVAQFDGGQRVEAEVGEGPVGFDGGRVGVSEHGGDLGAQEVEQVPLAGRAGQGGDLAAQDRLRVRGGAVRAAAGTDFGQVADEGPVRGEHGRVPLPVDVGDEEGGVAVADDGVEGGEGVLGAHRGEAAAADPVLDAGAVAGHAGAGPGTPGHGGGGQAQVAPVLGQGVQVGVGRGVVGLAGGAEDARGRGEEHEVGEAEVAGQLVQVGAERALASRTVANRSGVRVSSRPSSRTPAACTTAVSGCSSGTADRVAASAARSDVSQATTVTRAPFSRSSATSSAAPGASGPRRPASSRCGVPRPASSRATWAPRAPVPPVIRTVPSGANARGAGPWGAGWRVRRRA